MKIVITFSVVAIFIACLGLLGLISFSAEQRRKEIGIRKVMGANLMNLAAVINKQFIVLLIVATALGVPLSYLAISTLMDAVYTYHMPITPCAFTLATVLLFLTSILTVSSLIFRVMRTNPAETLRAE